MPIKCNNFICIALDNVGLLLLNSADIAINFGWVWLSSVGFNCLFDM